MKVLVIGSGGREHALVWKLAQSPLLSRLYCAPGNAGTAEQAENVPIRADDIASLLAFTRDAAIDFTVVGPEFPLALGIVDRFRHEGRAIFGPTQQAAAIESSKVFAKSLMAKYGVPTAPFQTFSDPQLAERYIAQHPTPLVVKADGLAAGKGAIVCQTRDSALEAVDQMMRAKVFGEAGAQVVIEQFLRGEELSFFALTDGTMVVPLPVCQDHKAIYDGDEGPNTGGMGAYSPVPVVDVALSERIMNEIMRPTVHAMAAEGRLFQGVLYAGLMLDEQSAVGHRIQCPLRRSRGASLDDATAERSPAPLVGDHGWDVDAPGVPLGGRGGCVCRHGVARLSRSVCAWPDDCRRRASGTGAWSCRVSRRNRPP